MYWDSFSWESDFTKGMLVQTISVILGFLMLVLAYTIFGIPYVSSQSTYSGLIQTNLIESLLLSLKICFLMGWLMGFLITSLLMILHWQVEIESLTAFFSGSLLIGFTSMTLISGLHLVSGLVWGLALSMLGTVIMGLINQLLGNDKW